MDKSSSIFSTMRFCSASGGSGNKSSLKNFRDTNDCTPPDACFFIVSCEINKNQYNYRISIIEDIFLNKAIFLILNSVSVDTKTGFPILPIIANKISFLLTFERSDILR